MQVNSQSRLSPIKTSKSLALDVASTPRESRAGGLFAGDEFDAVPGLFSAGAAVASAVLVGGIAFLATQDWKSTALAASMSAAVSGGSVFAYLKLA